MVESSRGHAFEDLTARARIRQAALAQFAEHGYERRRSAGSRRPPASRRVWCATTSVPNRHFATRSTPTSCEEVRRDQRRDHEGRRPR